MIESLDEKGHSFLNDYRLQNNISMQDVQRLAKDLKETRLKLVYLFENLKARSKETFPNSFVDKKGEDVNINRTNFQKRSRYMKELLHTMR